MPGMVFVFYDTNSCVAVLAIKTLRTIWNMQTSFSEYLKSKFAFEIFTERWILCLLKMFKNYIVRGH